MISIACLIYKSTVFADAVYSSIYEHTPLLHNGGAEFFFVANDATDGVISHLIEKQYKHYIHINDIKTDDELFAMGIGWPNYLHGVYKAWNKAIDLAKGDIVVLVNSDMMFSKNWLENLLKHYNNNDFICSELVERNHPKHGLFPGVVHQEFGNIPSNFNKVDFEFFAKEYMLANKNKTKPGGAYMPCMFNKQKILQIGKYPEGNLARGSFTEIDMYGDQNLIFKLKNAGGEHITAMDSIVYHFKEGEMDEKMTIKINIGCGPYKENGYTNIDKNPVWEPDLVCDVRNGLPFEDGTIDEIRAWHFIEHLDKDEIIKFLRLAYVKLKDNGIFNILFPVGVTYDLDHKSYLDKTSFQLLYRGGNDDFYFGEKIAFSLVSENDSNDGRCQMLQLVMRKR